MPNPTPLESEEGKTFIAYLRRKGLRFFHVPNETGSSDEAKRRAGRMKQQGVSRGVPDYFVIVGKTLIAIELKRVKGSATSPEQREWLDALAHTGMPCFIARGAAEAIEAVESIANPATKPNRYVASDIPKIDIKGFSGGMKEIF